MKVPMTKFKFQMNVKAPISNWTFKLKHSLDIGHFTLEIMGK